MTPRNWNEYVRVVYSGPSGHNDDMRVQLQSGDPRIDKVEFEREYCRVDFDLDAREEVAQKVQQYRVDEVARLLEKVFEAGVAEGKSRVRQSVKEALGIRER